MLQIFVLSLYTTKWWFDVVRVFSSMCSARKVPVAKIAAHFRFALSQRFLAKLYLLCLGMVVLTIDVLILTLYIYV